MHSSILKPRHELVLGSVLRGLKIVQFPEYGVLTEHDIVRLLPTTRHPTSPMRLPNYVTCV